jgi:SAM-dependent methyltransferase
VTDEMDGAFWDEHWRTREADEAPGAPPNPHLVGEAAGLPRGTALDAGCGAGAEAVWLASQGWQVTAADISALALARAAELAEVAGVADRVQWVEADLTTWAPQATFDLVTTHYAHPAMPQLAFYDRLAQWVAPGGTLLVVGHAHALETGHGHHPPAEASVTAATIEARLGPTGWDVVTAEERNRLADHHERQQPGQHQGHGALPHDVVVRATRRH